MTCQPHRAARLVLVRRELDDLHALRRDVVLIPVEEHEVDLLARRRRGCRRRRRRGRRRRRAELHRQAGDDILCLVARLVFRGARREPDPREREHALVVEGWVGRCEITVIEVEGQQRVDVIPDTGDRLVSEQPAAAFKQSPADRYAWAEISECRAARRVPRRPERESSARRRRERVERHAVDDIDGADTEADDAG